MSGWMLPNSVENINSDPGNLSSAESIPIPVHCAPLSDKDSANSKEKCSDKLSLNNYQNDQKPIKQSVIPRPQFDITSIFSKFM